MSSTGTMTDSPMRERPSYIPLPPPPLYGSFTSGMTPGREDLTPDSPYLQFFTAPSSPFVDLNDPVPSPGSSVLHNHVFPVPLPSLTSPGPGGNPPSPPLHFPSLRGMAPGPNAASNRSGESEYFPSSNNDEIGFGDDESLTALEKIYLFSRSKNSFHRVFIVHALPAFLDQISSQEAVDYVLPLLSGLAIDEEDSVREVLAQELGRIMWWFFVHCQVITELDDIPVASTSTQAFLYSQSFTPILGTLLLDMNGDKIPPAARSAIVLVLSRIFALDSDNASEQHQPHLLAELGIEPDHRQSFPTPERTLVRDELIHRVVIGMGRLDQPWDADTGSPSSHPLALKDSSPAASDSPRDHYFARLTNASSAHSSPSRTSFGSLPSTPGVGPSPSPSSLSRPLPSENQPQSALLSPHVEISPSTPQSDGGHSNPSQPDEEQAAMGRLTSMSLIAGIAASGSFTEATKMIFITEVVRVSQDCNTAVRGESCYAIGALAKVVPAAIVTSKLLPVLTVLMQDDEEHVRYSSLYALPPLLARLPLPQRKELVVRNVVPMAEDSSAMVRNCLLNSLGEVIATFLSSGSGPPSELLDLFTGHSDDLSVYSGEKIRVDNADRLRMSLHSMFGGAVPASTGNELPERPLDAFFSDPRRPYICAFNFPVITLALGPRRWPELRGAYTQLAKNEDPDVQQTLAASAGEMGKILGEDVAGQDIFPVWEAAITSKKERIVGKAIESAPILAQAVPIPAKKRILTNILIISNSDALGGWRNRESLAVILAELSINAGMHEPSVPIELCVQFLKDPVFAVRKATVLSVPSIWSIAQYHLPWLQREISNLLASPSYRHRITYVACLEVLLMHAEALGIRLSVDQMFQSSCSKLAEDMVADVRIAGARVIVRYRAMLNQTQQPPPQVLLDSIRQLESDSVQAVRAFVSESGASTAPNSPSTTSTERTYSSTFSRPP
ncbi:armadillo-type protein [Flagelloscypha sp. PMI_526]|nr:armadillo-type protein [Flagelloscypha sp. PMI_526]